jgi:hypothetical protein
VVEREVCQVSTKGTRVNNYLDSENFEGDPRQVRHCFLAPVVHTKIDLIFFFCLQVSFGHLRE